MTNTEMTLHAHVSTAARDCDGGHGQEYVSRMTDEERASHFPDLDFKGRVLSNHVSFSPLVDVRVTVTEEGFTMSETTDEGHRSAEVRWCEEECPEERDSGSQYDQYAELAGY